MSTLRIGVLGAAKIAPNAIVKPARIVEGVEIVGIAARDSARAARFAAKHSIPTVHPTYDDLINAEDLDAVYIPLPNGLHAEWTIKALGAGKHVMCEKPFTANADEARTVAKVAEESGLTVMEAFHYRYHPLAERMRAIAHRESEFGDLGAVKHIETALCFPLPSRKDIRYRWDLAGGAAMDAGCYAIHCLRLLGSGTPQVVAARAKLRDPHIDRAMTADFRFPDGATGRITASMWSRDILKVAARVTFENGEMRVLNFVAPHLHNRLTVKTTGGPTHRERVKGEATYTHQLRAFAAAVRGENTNLTPPQDSIITMGLIDAVYRAAGLPIRGGD